MNSTTNPSVALPNPIVNAPSRTWFGRLLNRSKRKNVAVADESISLSNVNDVFDVEEYHNPMLGINADLLAK